MTHECTLSRCSGGSPAFGTHDGDESRDARFASKGSPQGGNARDGYAHSQMEQESGVWRTANGHLKAARVAAWGLNGSGWSHERQAPNAADAPAGLVPFRDVKRVKQVATGRSGSRLYAMKLTFELQ
ncbi:unnamed protein product [Rhizoctonia solani]|uniref:Uncharacterized protein n=1 Tax=Rhizoctonia solani TaxID=456999 RepID=A0A8H3B741_9AGAM|nr:unnamed protein product [Rhizoctonia solani]